MSASNRSLNDKQIVIIGFMGSGKSTVARALARELDCGWVDLDAVITRREHRTPKEIIEQDGEAKFREIETRTLRNVLETDRVIALGGGAWTISECRRMISDKRACAVWLDAPFELCWKRIEQSNRQRPLARSLEMARALYNERRPIYSLADLRIVVDETKTPDEVARAIVAALSRQKPNN